MYDRNLVVEIIEQIIDAVKTIQKRCNFAKSYEDFIHSEEGQEKLDSICMKFIAIGESLKKIDKITHKSLLEQYPQVEWKKVKGIRDFISHHYFDLDAEVIYDICQNHLNTLLITLFKIKRDLESNY
ncbi:HepT-like ribonuclease domain-containing protein [Nitratiruptor sp. SB155-2]|uniref:HepT-like ribonuclease domain-containing protein n=1 Tax=Nitratiruptor sp. (strain SB155-2) TaxID=387092 RepID=UPI0001586D7E|nr:HepT-like ribonuclease domain-containing protein [Nitratiruptor sp. SB155-2]BAF69689.1 conserved hypothetical protein [Nitratiruptor sp. SB155-2]